MNDDSCRYYGGMAAAEIINLHFDPSQPKCVLYGRIREVILNAMWKAFSELNDDRLHPSEN